MPTFILIGKYSNEATREMSPDRTSKTIHLIKELGGEVKSMYALLGDSDIFMKVELPDMETAMKVSLGLNVLTGISFNTYPAVAVDDFDRMFSKH